MKFIFLSILAFAQISNAKFCDRKSSFKDQDGVDKQIPSPFLYQNIKGMGVVGLIDATATQALVDKQTDSLGEPKQVIKNIGGGKGLAMLYSVKFPSTALGQIDAIFLAFQTPNGWYSYRYNQNNSLNFLWKRDFWGLDTIISRVDINIDNGFKTVKAHATLDSKRADLEMGWDARRLIRERKLKVASVIEDFAFVANHQDKQPYTNFHSEGKRVLHKENKDGAIEFQAKTDYVWSRSGSEWNKILTTTQFFPLQWLYYPQYSGYVDFCSTN